MKKKQTLSGTLLAVVVIGVLIYTQMKKGGDSGDPSGTKKPDPAGPGSISCRCTRVVDGDTIIVDFRGSRERVRLVGVDTPESADPRREVAWFGKESAAFTKKMLEGRTVELEFKPDERRDDHGRMLAYVHRDGEDFCARLIREGYAKSFRRYPHPRLAEYNRLEQEARAARRGLWKKQPDRR